MNYRESDCTTMCSEECLHNGVNVSVCEIIASGRFLRPGHIYSKSSSVLQSRTSTEYNEGEQLCEDVLCLSLAAISVSC